MVEVDPPVPATCRFCGMIPSGIFSALMVAKPKEKRASMVTARQKWASTICGGRMKVRMRIDTQRFSFLVSLVRWRRSREACSRNARLGEDVYIYSEWRCKGNISKG